MSQRNITDTDEGKRVVNASGDTIGMVKAVRSGTAYVDPDPGLGDRIRTRLGWEDVEADDYPLDESTIETITDDEIRLKQDIPT